MMNTKNIKVLFWIPTILLSILMILSASMYFLNYNEVSAIFLSLGHPTHVIYPLAVLKILGVVAIISRKSNTLKEWAYAGFFFNFLLAFMAHYHAEDGGHITALVSMILLILSYFFGKKLDTAS